jgi:hypothetical protein
MIHDIPVFGPPLAGKSSFLSAAAAAAGISGRSVETKLRSDDTFNGAPVRLFELRFNRPGETLRVWCMPGGSEPRWPLQFVSLSSAALFVADAQRTRHDADTEYWQVVRDVVPIDRWFAVVTKCDLANADEQINALPPELRSRPHHRIASHEKNDIAAGAYRFLAEVVFASLARGG